MENSEGGKNKGVRGPPPSHRNTEIIVKVNKNVKT